MTQKGYRRDAASSSRGQSLVEFALVVPVLLLLLMIALDFGRVYLGYVNLQNLARIAANFAANEPDAWGPVPDLSKQARYEAVVLNDATATNCDLPGEPDVVPAPIFEDRNGDGDSRDLGDLARVQLTCSFAVITPGISSIVGSPLAVSTEAVFPIKSGLAQTSVAPGGPGGPVGGSAPTAAFSADDISGAAPHTVTFRDESGGNPTAWNWDFGDGSASGLQDPTYTYTADGVYEVTLVASNSFGSDSETKTAYVVVGPATATVAFVADRTSGTAPLQVRFTDQSAGSPTGWQWDFGDGGSAATKDPVHDYTAPGTYTVTLTVTTASGPESLVKSGYISVGVGLCRVPDFVNGGLKFSQAQPAWADAGFTTTVQRRVGAPTRDFNVNYQSIVGNSDVPCGSTIELDK